METLATIVLISLVCNGLYLVTSEGYLLYFVREWLDKKLIKSRKTEGGILIQEEEISWLYYPLLYCIVCMASFYSLIWFLLFENLTLANYLRLPFVMAGVSFLNLFLWNLLIKIND